MPSLNRQFVYLATIVAAIGLLATPGCEQATSDAIVSGGSMAPTFPGEHFQLHCDDCQYRFAIDANNVPQSGLAVCPLCGYSQIDFRSLPLQPTTKMIVTPVDVTADANTIKRWDVIAFEDPEANNRGERRLLTKRVVSLPGETIQFQAGNLLANGRIARKPASLNKQICIPIFDSSFPTRSNTNRFVPAQPDSHWEKTGKGAVEGSPNDWTFEIPAEEKSDNEFDWLHYQPIRGYRHSGERNEVCSIEDSYGYNQNVPRQLHRVNEFILRFKLKQTDQTGKAEFVVDVATPNDTRCRIDFHFERRKLVVVARNGVTKEIEANWLNSTSSVIEISNIDHQLRILHNDEEVYLETELDRFALEADTDQRAENRGIEAANGNVASPVQIKIGARGGDVQLSKLQIFRDIYYYLDSRHSSVGNSNDLIELGADEYFVLGDNAPISVDSRVFGPIRKDSIIGLIKPPVAAD